MDFQQAYDQLNPRQRQAVDAVEGPVLVLAGPGTGKTQILSTRIANILRLTQAEPHNVLALTFTNSGAKNMQQRLVGLMGATGYGVKCATFHSFCQDVIRSNPDLFPILPANSDQPADVERYALIEEILSASDFPLLKPFYDPLSNSGAIINLISNYKREGHDILSLRALAEAELSLVESGELKKAEAAKRRKLALKNLEFIEIFGEYQRLMHERGLFDYDDIILWVRDAFRTNEDLLADFQEKYQYVLVDEFQDTNQSQLQVVQLLCRDIDNNPNLFVVGDPNQSIYRFQGASLANTISFLDQYPEAEIITLQTGYRCGQPIYEAAANLISHNQLALEGERWVELAQPLQNFAGATAQLFTHEASNTLAECFWIAQRIQSLVQQGVDLDEVAILYHDHKHAKLMETVLAKEGIAYEIDDGNSILDQIFIVQILRLLRFLVQLQRGDEAPDIVPVLQQIWFKLDPEDVLRVVRAAQVASTEKSPWTILTDDVQLDKLPLRRPQQLKQLRDNLILWQHRDGQIPVSALVEEVLRQAGIFAHLLSDAAALPNLNSLTSLLRNVHQWSQQTPDGRLSAWLDRLDRMKRYNLRIPENDLDLRQRSVRLSSAHKAKGQEWDHVFVLHAQDKYWGNRRARGDKLQALPGTVPYAELGTEETNEDERRLFYVCLTRARLSVTVCWSQRTLESDRVSELQPTQFMQEVGGEWEALPALPPDQIRLQLADYLSAEPKTWLSEQVSRDWIKSLLDKFSLSATALDAYLECPADFLFSSLIRLPRPPVPAMAVGSAAHAALELAFRKLGEGGALPPLEQLLARAEAEIAKYPFPPSQAVRVVAEAKTLLAEYINSQSSSFAPALEVEKFIGRNPPVSFNGLALTGKIDRIDLLSESDRSIKVVDYKSGKPKTRRTLLGQNQEKNSYLRQLTFYALLADLDPTFNYHVQEGEIVFLKPKDSGDYTSEVFEISTERLNELKNLLTTVATELETLAFLERPACGQCDTCSHLGLSGSDLHKWLNLTNSESSAS